MGDVQLSGAATHTAGPVPSCTFAQLPTSGRFMGEQRRVSDVGVGGSHWEWNGFLWRPVNDVYRHHRLAYMLTGASTANAQILDYTEFPPGLLDEGDEIEVFLRVYKSGTSDTLAIRLLFESVLDPGANTVFSVNLATTTAHLATKQRFRVASGALMPVNLNSGAAYGATTTGGLGSRPISATQINYLMLSSQRTVGTSEIPYVYGFAVEVFK